MFSRKLANAIRSVYEDIQPLGTNPAYDKGQAESSVKQTNDSENARLSEQSAEMDKQIAKLQGSMSAGNVKPADIQKLNQLLATKKQIQDKIMRSSGNPTTN